MQRGLRIPSALVAYYVPLYIIIDASNRSLHRFFRFFGHFIDGMDHDKGGPDGQVKNQLLTRQEDKTLATQVSTSTAAGNMGSHDFIRNSKEIHPTMR